MQHGKLAESPETAPDRRAEATERQMTDAERFGLISRRGRP